MRDSAVENTHPGKTENRVCAICFLRQARSRCVAYAISLSLLSDEGRLASLALDGLGEAWNTLIKRHNHRVLVSLLARGIPMDRAKELVQETWLQLIEQQRRGRLQRIELPGLAIRQAFFLAMADLRRRHPGRAEPLTAFPVEVPVAVVDSVEREILTKQQLAQAQRALGECSESARQVFRLLYEDPDRAHLDVANEVGLSIQRVRQIICEVRKKLRPILEE